MRRIFLEWEVHQTLLQNSRPLKMDGYAHAGQIIQQNFVRVVEIKDLKYLRRPFAGNADINYLMERQPQNSALIVDHH